MKTLEHYRIEVAYGATEQASAFQPKWLAIMQSFGSEIQRCGLLQAVAFLARTDNKDKNAANHAGKTVLKHLIDRGFIGPPSADRSNSDLFDVLRALDVPQYMQVTREVLALSMWLKRAATAKGK